MRLLRFTLPVGGAVLAAACLVAAIHQIENEAVSPTEIRLAPAAHVIPAPLPAPVPTPNRPVAPTGSPAPGRKGNERGIKGQKNQAAPKTESPKPDVALSRNLDTGVAETATQVRRLRKALISGRMTLLNGERDGDQLRELEASGQCAWPPSPEQIAAQKAETESARKANQSVSRVSPNVSRVSPNVGESEMPDDGAGILGSDFGAEASSSDALCAASALSETDKPAFSKNHTARKSVRAAANAAPNAGVSHTANPAETETPNPDAVQNSKPKIQNPVTRPDPAMLRFLTTLAAHASPARPLEVMSLLRPPYKGNGYRHAGPRNPHSLGMAADISAYGGHRVAQSDPEACVQATLAILRDLPPGRYRLGMPKAPESARADELTNLLASLDAFPASPPAASAPASGAARSLLPSRHKVLRFAPPVPTSGVVSGLLGSAAGLACAGLASVAPAASWPFFPAPESVTDASGAKTVRWRNESYAPEAELADLRIRRALESARRRGANVYALFPDAADHVHVDVR